MLRGMGAEQRGKVIELWCWGMPVSYIARHLQMREEDVRAIVGPGINGGRQ